MAIKIDQTLDCRGLLCPLPVIKTTKAVKSLAVGQVLELLATDPGSKPDMEAWSRQTGNEIAESRQEGSVFHFLIRRTR
jgi:tRNA 2-thiouridine synthesizing protein A